MKLILTFKISSCFVLSFKSYCDVNSFNVVSFSKFKVNIWFFQLSCNSDVLVSNALYFSNSVTIFSLWIFSKS